MQNFYLTLAVLAGFVAGFLVAGWNRYRYCRDQASMGRRQALKAVVSGGPMPNLAGGPPAPRPGP